MSHNKKLPKVEKERMEEQHIRGAGAYNKQAAVKFRPSPTALPVCKNRSGP
jgi:hypothetical protein